MYDLTQRQIEILKRIVKEYIDTAEPIGSETLEKKYDLGVSPATIRNEMAQMIKLGYLSKPHSSAGRIPTSKAMKFYVSELMKEKELSLAETVEEKEKIWDLREHQAQFLREITRALAAKTRALAVTTTDTLTLTTGLYEIKVRAENSKGKSSEATIKIGVNKNWDEV
jgi:heat-inducible transcriptional repressor